MNFLRSITFNIFLYLGITAVFIIALPALFLPPVVTLTFGKFLGSYVIFLLRVLMNTSVEFIGKENLPKNEKFFVASIHQSMFETFAFQSVIKHPIFILKKELLRIPLFGSYLKKIGCIAIKRDTVTKDNLGFFEKIKNVTSATDRPLLIFPQGTRVKPNEYVPLKKGVGKIYETLNIKCIPITHNSGNVWPKNSFLKFPGTIKVNFLPAINPGLGKNFFLEELEKIFYKKK